MASRNRGLMGFDALILFIAILMVVGVTAILLITSNNALSGKALTKVHEQRKEVSGGVEIVGLRGEDASVAGGTPHYVEDVYMTVRLLPGVLTIDFNETQLVYNDGTAEFVMFFNTTCSDVCVSTSTRHFNVHYLNRGNHWERGHLNIGDVALLGFAPQNPIKEETEYNIGVIPAYGPATWISFLTPQHMVKEKVSLWPVD